MNAVCTSLTTPELPLFYKCTLCYGTFGRRCSLDDWIVNILSFAYFLFWQMQIDVLVRHSPLYQVDTKCNNILSE